MEYLNWSHYVVFSLKNKIFSFLCEGVLTILVFPGRGKLQFPVCKAKHSCCLPVFEKTILMCPAGVDQQADLLTLNGSSQLLRV
jgi:hypothetical protein